MRKYRTRGLYLREIRPQYNLEWTETNERNYKLVWERRGLNPPIDEFRSYHRPMGSRYELQD